MADPSRETPSIPVDEAYALLQGVADAPIYREASEPRTLMAALVRLAEHQPREVIDGVCGAVLYQELQTLSWRTMDGTRFVRLCLQSGSPSDFLVRMSMCYLSLYFQELDSEIERCRAMLDAHEETSVVLAELLPAIDSIWGIDEE